jgi:hypothetical protein
MVSLGHDLANVLGNRYCATLQRNATWLLVEYATGRDKVHQAHARRGVRGQLPRVYGHTELQLI